MRRRRVALSSRPAGTTAGERYYTGRYAADSGVVPGRAELGGVGFRADREAADGDEKAAGAPPGARAAAPTHRKSRRRSPVPNSLGVGVRTERVYCDVMSGRDPAEGILITLPPHRGPVTLTFDLHNRHTYSEEQVKAEPRLFPRTRPSSAC